MHYYIDERVWSPRYGLGVVIWSGPNPWVEFLAGERLQIDGATLQVVPDEVYDAEVAKRARVDRWLTWRVTGRFEPEQEHTPGPRSDLADRIRRSAGQGCLPFVADLPAELLVFCNDEMNRA